MLTGVRTGGDMDGDGVLSQSRDGQRSRRKAPPHATNLAAQRPKSGALGHTVHGGCGKKASASHTRAGRERRLEENQESLGGVQWASEPRLTIPASTGGWSRPLASGSCPTRSYGGGCASGRGEGGLATHSRRVKPKGVHQRVGEERHGEHRHGAVVQRLGTCSVRVEITPTAMT